MTYRERRLAKAERLQSWADTRIEKATTLRDRTPESLRHDHAFLTQPGIIPQRTRMYEADQRAYEHAKKAADFDSRAAAIIAAAARSIYSDDPDAIERLRERIAELEAKRDEIKARPHEAYELANLAGNIRRQRERLAQLSPEAAAELPIGKCCKHAKGYHRPADENDGDPRRCLYCSCAVPGTYGQKRKSAKSPYDSLYQRMGIEHA